MCFGFGSWCYVYWRVSKHRNVVRRNRLSFSATEFSVGFLQFLNSFAETLKLQIVQDHYTLAHCYQRDINLFSTCFHTYELWGVSWVKCNCCFNHFFMSKQPVFVSIVLCWIGWNYNVWLWVSNRIDCNCMLWRLFYHMVNLFTCLQTIYRDHS